MRYLFADCLLDTQCYLLRRAGQLIRLRPKVFQALTYLLTNRDRVIAKQELCEQVWSAQAVSDATMSGEPSMKLYRKRSTLRLIESDPACVPFVPLSSSGMSSGGKDLLADYARQAGQI